MGIALGLKSPLRGPLSGPLVPVDAAIAEMDNTLVSTRQ